MITDIERALMAGRTYIDTRAEINLFPIPEGWTDMMNHKVEPSGFEAVFFQRGSEDRNVPSKVYHLYIISKQRYGLISA